MFLCALILVSLEKCSRLMDGGLEGKEESSIGRKVSRLRTEIGKRERLGRVGGAGGGKRRGVRYALLATIMKQPKRGRKKSFPPRREKRQKVRRPRSLIGVFDANWRTGRREKGKGNETKDRWWLGSKEE